MLNLKVCNPCWDVKVVDTFWRFSEYVAFYPGGYCHPDLSERTEHLENLVFSEIRFGLSIQISVFPDLATTFPFPTLYGWKVWCSRICHLNGSQFPDKLDFPWRPSIGCGAEEAGEGRSEWAPVLPVSVQQFSCFPGNQDQLDWVPRSALPYTPALSRCTGSWEALVCRIQPSSGLAIRINLQADRFWLWL